MTDHTDEELIALAKKCGITGIPNSNPVVMQALLPELRAFASAVRQQDLARMARMREALNHVDAYLDDVQHGENCFVSNHYEGDPGNQCNCGKDAVCQNVDEALSETSDIQVWLDGQRADAFDDAAKECREWESATKVLGICDRAEYQRLAYINVATVFSDMAAELRARSTKGEG